METIRIDILNPKALNLLQDLAELKLIRISKDYSRSDFINLVNEVRAKSKDEISLEEITKEVEKVRKARYDKK